MSRQRPTVDALFRRYPDLVTHIEDIPTPETLVPIIPGLPILRNYRRYAFPNCEWFSLDPRARR